MSFMRLSLGSMLFASTLVLCNPTAWSAVSGADIYKEVLEGTDIYDDPKLDAYIKKLGNEIIAVSEMAGEEFTFTLLDSPDLNAFATRDNYIYVNRGLLNYVSNEAQLVSVLAHEVGHITRDHVTGQEAQATGAQILSTIAAVLSGSNEVYEAGMAYANSLIRGHGRRNELEADEAGAEYMAKLGYAPNEMISMLSIMKDYETLQKDRAKAKGASKQTYHGIFSSHPRNDSRLRTVVTKANAIKSSETRDNGASRYRQLTDGLIWGENFLAKEKKSERFSNMSLRVRFDFPKGWVQNPNPSPSLASATPENKTAVLKMRAMPRTSQNPEEYLYNYLKVSQLKDGKAIAPSRLKGFTGILPGGEDDPDSRIAVIYYKLNAYIFSGEITQTDPQAKAALADNKASDQTGDTDTQTSVATFADIDKQFVASIKTFRPISSREIAGQKPKTVHYVKATNATTFDKLNKALNLNAVDREDLRIINGHYPSGEPKAGDWIKIFKQ
ncbi:MAG: M48 family metalloprotease [Porticoccaceae bacterium]|jgi:predicted Zn-dependent protease|nr:M48 family metalloprotease [Porticoccaceae bacterium]